MSYTTNNVAQIRKLKKIRFEDTHLDLTVMKYTTMFPYLEYIYEIEFHNGYVLIAIDDVLDENLLWDLYEEHQSLEGDYTSLLPIIYENRFAELVDWIEIKLNSVAKSHGYDDIKSCRSYTGFENSFRYECTTLSKWASDVWVEAFKIKDAIIAGTKTFPENKEEVYADIPLCPLGDGPHTYNVDSKYDIDIYTYTT